jgi:hypothetical protein
MKPALAAPVRKIDQLDHLAVLDHRHRTTAETRRPSAGLLNMDHQRLTGNVIDADHAHRGQSDKDLRDASSVSDHRGSSGL